MVPTSDHSVIPFGDVEVRTSSIAGRIGRALLRRSRATIAPFEKPTTTTGQIQTQWEAFERAFQPVSIDRTETYNEVVEMEQYVSEVCTGLDALADEAVNNDKGAEGSFRIIYIKGGSVRVRNAVEETLKRVKIHEKMYGICRDLLLYGDNFQQVVVDRQFQVVRLMYMPPATMVRNEDRIGLLKRGSTPGEWAFEQYDKDMNNFIAGFKPWQIMHLRWNRRGSDPYGRSLLNSAREPYRKLRAMEEALCSNWLTRAFARLLYTVDTTNMSEKEARLYVARFKESLQTTKLADGVIGQEELSVVKDIFVGKGYTDVAGKPLEGLTDVSILDTSSTGFGDLDPIKYFRRKIITALRVPALYLGLDAEGGVGRTTISYQDRRYTRTIRGIQQVLTEFINSLVEITLLLEGVRPDLVEYYVEWPNPSRRDQFEQSQMVRNFAQAADILIKLGVVDPEFIATDYLNLREDQWSEILARLEKLKKSGDYPFDDNNNGDGRGRPDGALGNQDGDERERFDDKELDGTGPQTRQNQRQES